MTTNDFDPTKNRVPFGLMSKEEQESLKAWPHGWESWSAYTGWVKKQEAWNHFGVFCGKPAPVVTSKWFNVYPSGPMPRAYSHRETADSCANDGRIAVLRIDTCNGVSKAHLEGV